MAATTLVHHETRIIADDNKKPTVFSRWVSNNLTTGGMMLSASVGHREGAALNQAQYECLPKSDNNRRDGKKVTHET